MSRLHACRVCLAHHSRMFSLLNGPLQEFYENITEIPLVVGDLWPTCICYICYQMMRKFKKFIDKSLKANDLLLQLISSESEYSLLDHAIMFGLKIFQQVMVARRPQPNAFIFLSVSAVGRR
ncbi:hypothetical protein evm_013773 [Chilo suppressalis]|nr:hypothetical protein evm_013773 [Chilo suppressalis]